MNCRTCDGSAKNCTSCAPPLVLNANACTPVDLALAWLAVLTYNASHVALVFDVELLTAAAASQSAPPALAAPLAPLLASDLLLSCVNSLSVNPNNRPLYVISKTLAPVNGTQIAQIVLDLSIQADEGPLTLEIVLSTVKSISFVSSNVAYVLPPSSLSLTIPVKSQKDYNYEMALNSSLMPQLLGNPYGSNLAFYAASADPTGTLGRVLNMLLFSSRLYYLNVRTGNLTHSFLDKLEAFENTCTETRNLDYELESTMGWRGRLSVKRVSRAYNRELPHSVRTGSYLVSSVVKLLCRLALARKVRGGLMLLVVMQYWDKIHLIFLNMLLLDVHFYGVHALLHFRFTWNRCLLGLLFTLSILDFIDLYNVALRAASWQVYYKTSKNRPLRHATVQLAADRPAMRLAARAQSRVGVSSSAAIDYRTSFRNIGLRYFLIDVIQAFIDLKSEHLSSHCAQWYSLLQTVRWGVFYLLMVSLQYLPLLALFLILSFELYRIGMVMYGQLKYRLFKYRIVLLVEIVSMLSFLLVIGWLAFICINPSFRDGNSMQYNFINAILCSIILEFILFSIRLVYIVYGYFKDRRKVADKGYEGALWFIGRSKDTDKQISPEKTTAKFITHQEPDGMNPVRKSSHKTRLNSTQLNAGKSMLKVRRIEEGKVLSFSTRKQSLLEQSQVAAGSARQILRQDDMCGTETIRETPETVIKVRGIGSAKRNTSSFRFTESIGVFQRVKLPEAKVISTTTVGISSRASFSKKVL